MNVLLFVLEVGSGTLFRQHLQIGDNVLPVFLLTARNRSSSCPGRTCRGPGAMRPGSLHPRLMFSPFIADE